MRELLHSAIGLAGVVSLTAMIACGASAGEDASMGSKAGDPSAYPGTGGGAGSGGGGALDAGADSGLPPEQEVESSYESPVATGRFVWVTNPVSGRVAYVDAATLEVRTIAAGNGPRYIAAVPSDSQDIAVVVNALSSDATILRAVANGDITIATVDIAEGANAWAVSHNGGWAVAWTDAKVYANPDPVQGFQDVTVVNLTPGAESAKRLTVGYRPVALSFSSDDKQAYAVTQDGVSVIDLTSPQGPQSSKVVPISDNAFEDPDTRDVSITPDGAYALVRRDGQSTITVVSLADGKLIPVQLSGACTDLDLSPDGTRALAAVRSEGEIAILPVPGIATAPDTFEVVKIDKATVGSVAIAPSAPMALIYTNAVEEERITKLSFDVSPASVKTLKLHASVLSVFPSYTGASAIVVHQAIDGAPGAFSTLSLAPELPAKIVATGAPVMAVALTPSGDRAVVAERSDSMRVYGAYLIRNQNQQVDRYDLSSPPISVGTVAGAKRAFVAQEHPEGRLTFIDLDTGLARTLTGFELGARVIDGSNP